VTAQQKQGQGYGCAGKQERAEARHRQRMLRAWLRPSQMAVNATQGKVRRSVSRRTVGCDASSERHLEMPPKARGVKSTKHAEAPPRPASAAGGGKQQRSRSAPASRRALVPSRRGGDDEDDDDDDGDADDDADDDELPVLTLEEEEEGGGDGESSDDGSDGELGGARGRTFGAAFRDALVAGGDRAEDVPELGGERGSRQRSGGRGGAAATAQTRVTGAAALPDGSIVPRAETVRRRGRDGQQRRKAALLGEAAFVADRGSDSSDDERGVRNTVGNVPAQWYAGEEHVGYDVEGKKLLRSRKGAPGDALEAHLAKQDSSRAWRTLYDPVNDETYTLTAEEVALIQRLRDGGVPGGEGDFDPYAPALDWADFDGLLATNGVVHPISSGPEPKRRFVPSAWEAKRVVKLIRALRRGWIKPAAERAAAAAAKTAAHGAPYLLWDDDAGASSKTAAGLARIAPPQERLPGHEESYNPPLEYIPTEEEVKEMHKQEEFTGRKAFIPKRYANMRSIPAYERFIHERFERCLDLYLCPRVARQRLQVDPKSLLPQLPKPSELRPFPSALGIEYKQPSDDGPPVLCASHRRVAGCRRHARPGACLGGFDRPPSGDDPAG
jgi:BOP1NT (NUC169) domain